MSFEVIRRATLLTPTYFPQKNLPTHHLSVVMCEPNSSGRVLLVSVSTFDEGNIKHDSTCLLERGDHPFIKHTSYVQYKTAIQESASVIKQRAAIKYYIAREMIAESVFQRMLDGFYASRFAPRFAFDDFLPPHR